MPADEPTRVRLARRPPAVWFRSYSPDDLDIEFMNSSAGHIPVIYSAEMH